MRKLLYAVCIAMTAVFVFIPSSAHATGEASAIDDSALENGIVKVSCKSSSSKPLKVFVQKGTARYTYDLKGNGAAEAFPLQLGNGEYTVSILENIKDNRYRYIKTQALEVKLKNADAVYLNSIQNIRWDKDNKAIKRDIALIGKENSFEKKLKIIYEFVVRSFSYDYEKLKRLTSGYLPDIDKTLEEKKGICYDYSSLFAAMKRSEGVPTKLVKGYTVNAEGYHAWNEIKINGKWVIIDTTYDSTAAKAKFKYTMVKNPKDYRKVYEY